MVLFKVLTRVLYDPATTTVKKKITLVLLSEDDTCKVRYLPIRVSPFTENEVIRVNF